MTPEERALLKRNGWTVDSESPLEISKEESFAKWEAVDLVIEALKQEEKEETEQREYIKSILISVLRQSLRGFDINKAQIVYERFIIDLHSSGYEIVKVDKE